MRAPVDFLCFFIKSSLLAALACPRFTLVTPNRCYRRVALTPASVKQLTDKGYKGMFDSSSGGVIGSRVTQSRTNGYGNPSAQFLSKKVLA